MPSFIQGFLIPLGTDNRLQVQVNKEGLKYDQNVTFFSGLFIWYMYMTIATARVSIPLFTYSKFYPTLYSFRLQECDIQAAIKRHRSN